MAAQTSLTKPKTLNFAFGPRRMLHFWSWGPGRWQRQVAAVPNPTPQSRLPPSALLQHAPRSARQVRLLTPNEDNKRTTKCRTKPKVVLSHLQASVTPGKCTKASGDVTSCLGLLVQVGSAYSGTFGKRYQGGSSQ